MHRTMLQSALHGTTRRGKPPHCGGNVYPPARTFQAITILQSEFRKFPLVITILLRGECKTLQQYGQNLPLGDLLVSPPSEPVNRAADGTQFTTRRLIRSVKKRKIVVILPESVPRR